MCLAAASTKEQLFSVSDIVLRSVNETLDACVMALMTVFGGFVVGSTKCSLREFVASALDADGRMRWMLIATSLLAWLQPISTSRLCRCVACPAAAGMTL